MHEPLTLDEVINVVDDPKSILHLQQDFGMAGFADQFTGRRFEALAGGGDRHGAADRVNSEDLVAVQLLSVLVPREVALDLLEGVSWSPSCSRAMSDPDRRRSGWAPSSSASR